MKKPKYDISDYIGTRIGYSTVIGETDEKAKDGSFQWVFRCDCGKEFFAIPRNFIKGSCKSCGCVRFKNIEIGEYGVGTRTRVNPKDFIGRKNNLLTVIGIEKPESGGRLKLKCRCDCGNTTYVFPYQFTSGDVKSCGCKKKNIWNGHREVKWQIKHGLCGTRVYHEWTAMKDRCYNPNAQNYDRYGGRGIIMCDEWKNDVTKFADWVDSVGGFKKGLSVDRIDNNGPYAPWNCRLATAKEQLRNIRTNRILEYNGESHCMAEWAEMLGMKYSTLVNRLFKGWSVEKALTTPVNGKRMDTI